MFVRLIFSLVHFFPSFTCHIRLYCIIPDVFSVPSCFFFPLPGFFTRPQYLCQSHSHSIKKPHQVKCSSYHFTNPQLSSPRCEDPRSPPFFFSNKTKQNGQSTVNPTDRCALYRRSYLYMSQSTHIHTHVHVPHSWVQHRSGETALEVCLDMYVYIHDTYILTDGPPQSYLPFSVLYIPFLSFVLPFSF